MPGADPIVCRSRPIHMHAGLDFVLTNTLGLFPKEASDAELYFFFNKLKETLPRGYIRDLEKYGFTNKNSDLTKKGLDLIGRQATT